MNPHHRASSVAWPALGASVLATLVACAGTAGESGFGAGPDGGGAGGSGSSSGTAGSSGANPSGDDAGAVGMFGSSSGGGSGSSSGGGEAGAVGPIDVTAPCDSSLPIDGPASAFAQAMGICTQAAQAGWGLVSASYSNAYGGTAPPADGQWGLLTSFGILAPREGSTLGAISSGFGRSYDNIDGTDQGLQASAFVAGQPMDGTSYPTGGAPPGFPQAAQGCPQDNLVNDMVDVTLVLKAPPDATGFEFDFAFFSSEWPNYVCSNFNDAFVAYLSSSQTHGNISFDSMNNPVAVNIGFLDVCTPDAPIGCLRSDGAQPDPPLSNSICASGTPELTSTGYAYTDQTQCDQSNVTATLGASTGWLTTTAPIQPGEQFTLDLMIWDAGDGLLDSSVLLDHFRWLGGTPPATVTMPAPAQ